MKDSIPNLQLTTLDLSLDADVKRFDPINVSGLDIFKGPVVVDVEETLQRLCREGESIQHSLDISQEKVHEITKIGHGDKPEARGDEERTYDSHHTNNLRDLHSGLYLQSWLAAISHVLGNRLAIVITSHRGAIIEKSHRGIDASAFRLHSDLTRQVVREAIYRQVPIYSVQDVDVSLAADVQSEKDSSDGVDTREHYSVGLTRLSRHVGVKLVAIAVKLPNSDGYGVLLAEETELRADQRKLLENATEEASNENGLLGFFRELDSWLVLRKCKWSIAWMKRAEWCLHHPKALLIPLLCLTLGLLVPVPYFPRRDCTFEPELKQYLCSPVASKIATCEVRPGDRVVAGQLLAKLDDEPLRRELATAQAELEGASKKFDTALATKAAGDVAMAKAEIRKSQSRIEMLQEQLKQLEVRAVGNGIVVQGDWKKSIGMPVTLGQNLFEIAELTSMTAELHLTAFDLGQIETGKNVDIRSDSSGSNRYYGRISRIEPRATILDGKAIFIADVVVPNPEGLLRPGMKGKAQIQAGWRSVGWLLFGRPYRWVVNQWIW